MKTAKYFISFIVILLLTILSGNHGYSLGYFGNSYIFFSNAAVLSHERVSSSPFDQFSLSDSDDVTAVWKKRDNTLEIIGSGKIDRTKWFEMIEKFDFVEESSDSNKKMPWLHRRLFTLKIVDPSVQFPDDSSYLFAGFNGELFIHPDIDTSNVVDMSSMFLYSMTTDPDVSGWDTSNVVSFNSMFSITAAVPDVSKWDTSKAEDFSHMFSYSHNANPDVSGWDTSSAKDMSYMFFKSRLANPDVSKWNTQNVSNMKEMFAKSKSANPNISNWVINNKADEKTMFLDAQAYQTGELKYQALSKNTSNPSKSGDTANFSLDGLHSGALRLSSSSSTRDMFSKFVFFILLLAIMVVIMLLIRRRDLQIYEDEIIESPGGSRLLQVMSVILLILFFFGILAIFYWYEEIKIASGLGNSFEFSILMKAINQYIAYDKKIIVLLLLGLSQTVLIPTMGMLGLVRWKMPFKYKGLYMLCVTAIVLRALTLAFSMIFHYDNGTPFAIVVNFIVLGAYLMGTINNKNIYERSLKVNEFTQKKIYQNFGDEEEYIGGYSSSGHSDYYGQSAYSNASFQNAYPNENRQNFGGAHDNQNRNRPSASFGNNRYQAQPEEYDVYTSQEDYIKSNVVSLDAVNPLGNRTVRNSAFTNEDIIAQTTSSFSNTKQGNVNFRDSGFGYYSFDEPQEKGSKSQYPDR